MTEVLPCHSHLPACKPMNQASSAELQRRIQALEMKYYCKVHDISYKYHFCQRGSPCQDAAGNRTIWRPPDHCKQMQTEVVWICDILRSTDLAKTFLQSTVKGGDDEAEEEVGRQHQGMDRPWVCQVPDGRGEERKMEESGCEVICCAQRPMQLRDRWKRKVDLHVIDTNDSCFDLCAVNEGQGSAGRPAYQGVLHAMRTIVKNSGFVGLYQGVTPNVSGAGISWGCYFFLWVILHLIGFQA